MIRIDAVIARYPDLQPSLIADWVARGWVHVEGADVTAWVFTDLDIARLHLLRDLHVDLGLEADSLPIVLSLLDQVYSLRQTLRVVGEIVSDAPDPLRQRLYEALSPTRV